MKMHRLREKSVELTHNLTVVVLTWHAIHSPVVHQLCVHLAFDEFDEAGWRRRVMQTIKLIVGGIARLMVVR